MPSPTASSVEPLGANGDQRRRFLSHHLPLAAASALFVVFFTVAPIFDVTTYGHADIFTGPFPQPGTEPASSRAPDDRTGHHGGTGQTATGHGTAHTLAMSHHEQGRRVARAAEHGSIGHSDGVTGTGEPAANGVTADRRRDVVLSRNVQQVAVVTGYLGLGLLAVTLLLGPANLLLRRRNPVSTYLRRDVGIWTAIFSIGHVILAILIHVSHGSGVVMSVLHFFLAEDGRPLLNSFGLGNWTGLAALIIVVGLLVTSSDAALRRLKARPWKWVQRLTYMLFALVVLHAFFYGALLRMTSPFTLLLVLSVIAVCVGQAMGVWLWRRRYVVKAV